MIEILSVRPAQKKPLSEIFKDMERAMADFDIYMADERDREYTSWLERRPVCVCCGEHIQDDECYKVDGDIYCSDCMDNMRVQIEYYMED